MISCKTRVFFQGLLKYTKKKRFVGVRHMNIYYTSTILVFTDHKYNHVYMIYIFIYKNSFISCRERYVQEGSKVCWRT